MTKKVTDIKDARAARAAVPDHRTLNFFLSMPSTITGQQCAQGREVLGWTVEALAFRSGASVKAITQFESGTRELLEVTRQALAFSLEQQGLLFIPGFKPSRGNNCRGVTSDPRSRDDYHRIE